MDKALVLADGIEDGKLAAVEKGLSLPPLESVTGGTPSVLEVDNTLEVVRRGLWVKLESTELEIGDPGDVSTMVDGVAALGGAFKLDLLVVSRP